MAEFGNGKKKLNGSHVEVYVLSFRISDANVRVGVCMCVIRNGSVLEFLLWRCGQHRTCLTKGQGYKERI